MGQKLNELASNPSHEKLSVQKIDPWLSRIVTPPTTVRTCHCDCTGGTAFMGAGRILGSRNLGKQGDKITINGRTESEVAQYCPKVSISSEIRWLLAMLY